MILKIFVVLIIIIAALVYRRHSEVMKRADFYVKQGLVKLAGYDTFFLGNGK